MAGIVGPAGVVRGAVDCADTFGRGLPDRLLVIVGLGGMGRRSPAAADEVASVS